MLVTSSKVVRSAYGNGRFCDNFMPKKHDMVNPGCCTDHLKGIQNQHHGALWILCGFGLLYSH